MRIFFFIVIAAIIVAGAFYAGIQYMRFAETEVNIKKSAKNINRQTLAKTNRKAVGVSNFGTSMDDNPIFLVTDSDLGISE